MTQTFVMEREQGVLEEPKITLLGSLDDDRGEMGLGLDPEQPKPILAIIYNGI